MACEMIHPPKENPHGLCVFGNYAIYDKNRRVIQHSVNFHTNLCFFFLKGVNPNAY